jgi:hypothetical protein
MSVQPIKRALLIGINYISTPNARLNGCIDDIKNIHTMLMDAYGYLPENIVVLRDDNPAKLPTKQNIISAFQTIVAVSKPSDELWVYYCGHGTQVRDLNQDETDRLDEAIVPSDFQQTGVITDDDLFNLIRTVPCKTFLAFDSCHSGSVCDLQYTVDYNGGTFNRRVSSNKVISNSNIVLMSGCRDTQYSADIYDTNMQECGGAFTVSFVKCLRKNNHTADVMKIYNDVCYDLVQQKYPQIPVLSSSSMTPTFKFARPSIVSGSPVRFIVAPPVKSLKVVTSTVKPPEVVTPPSINPPEVVTPPSINPPEVVTPPSVKPSSRNNRNKRRVRKEPAKVNTNINMMLSPPKRTQTMSLVF